MKTLATLLASEAQLVRTGPHSTDMDAGQADSSARMVLEKADLKLPENTPDGGYPVD